MISIQKLWGALALISLSLSAVSKADQGVGMYFTDFCNHPNEAVCGAFSTSNVGRILRIAELRQRVSQVALDNTIRELHLSPKFQMSDLKKMSPWDNTRIPPVYFRSYNEQLDKEISSTERVALWGQIDNVKKYLLAAIDEHFSFSYDGTGETNTALKAEVNRTVIVDSAKMASMLQAKDVFAPGVFKEYIGTCGDDGLSDNAFAYAASLDKGKTWNKYLIVCPGFLLRAMGSGKDEASNFRNMSKVLGHEWGHHIDDKWFPQLYKLYAACMADYNNGGLRDVGPRPGNLMDLANSPDTRNRRVIETHINEMIGDFWGTQVIVQYFKKSLLSPLDFTNRLWFLRESHGALCRTEDEGSHPAGEYRMDVLLRTDRGIAKLMGCTEQYTHPTCTLKGLYLPAPKF